MSDTFSIGATFLAFIARKHNIGFRVSKRGVLHVLPRPFIYGRLIAVPSGLVNLVAERFRCRDE